MVDIKLADAIELDKFFFCFISLLRDLRLSTELSISGKTFFTRGRFRAQVSATLHVGKLQQCQTLGQAPDRLVSFIPHSHFNLTPQLFAGASRADRAAWPGDLRMDAAAVGACDDVFSADDFSKTFLL
jgi:hypothetical protein